MCCVSLAQHTTLHDFKAKMLGMCTRQAQSQETQQVPIQLCQPPIQPCQLPIPMCQLPIPMWRPQIPMCQPPIPIRRAPILGCRGAIQIPLLANPSDPIPPG